MVRGYQNIPQIAKAQSQSAQSPGLGGLGHFLSSQGNWISFATLRLILEVCVFYWGTTTWSGQGSPLRPLSILTFWDPESINHHSGILCVGSGKGWSVPQHWAEVWDTEGCCLLTLSWARRVVSPSASNPSTRAGKGPTKCSPS